LCREIYSRYLLTHPYNKVPHLRDFLFMHRYFIFYKPYLVLSQFTTSLQKKTLASFSNIPKKIYPVGRLDEDSEGLLLLTDDKELNHTLLNPLFAHEREYWVQVEGGITQQALQQLSKGVCIQVNGKKYITKPCKVFLFDKAPAVCERNPPVRERKNIPTSWISIILTEGKNRQVRKMTAKVGFPTLRLIRVRIEDVHLNGMLPGEIKQLFRNSVYKKLLGK